MIQELWKFWVITLLLILIYQLLFQKEYEVTFLIHYTNLFFMLICLSDTIVLSLCWIYAIPNSVIECLHWIHSTHWFTPHRLSRIHFKSLMSATYGTIDMWSYHMSTQVSYMMKTDDLSQAKWVILTLQHKRS